MKKKRLDLVDHIPNWHLQLDVISTFIQYLIMCHMFDVLHLKFVYVSRIGLGLHIIGQGQLIHFNFAKPPSTRLSVGLLFFVFLKLPHL